MSGLAWMTAQAYAHRGLHGEGRPENTLSAFNAAIDRGYGIELDVQLSKDGIAMVVHDAHLMRLAGTDAWVGDMTATELERMRIAGTEETSPMATLESANAAMPSL